MQSFLRAILIAGWSFSLLVLRLEATPAGKDEATVYRTPSKVKPAVASSPLGSRVFSPDTRALIIQLATAVPPTPEDQSSTVYRRVRIDEAPGYLEKTAERFARKNPESPKKWFERLAVLEANRALGAQREESSLASFGVPKNRESSLCDVSPAKDRKHSAKKKICCIPDGYGVDESGKKIVFEVKVKQPGSVLYASEQLRAEEKKARALGGRHIVAICSDTDDVASFPKPSSSFKKTWDLITEFRFTNKSGQTYRWFWGFGSQTGDGYWETVETEEAHPNCPL